VVNLVPPVAVVGEALEVDDQGVGQGPQVKLLGGLLVLLALGTVPAEMINMSDYKIQGNLLPNTGKYGAVSRLKWGETLASSPILIC